MPLNVKDLTTDELAVLLRAFNALRPYRKKIGVHAALYAIESALYQAIQDEFLKRD